MPKVTEAYRDARRDEIARAAMRCLTRQGFAGTSMADIIAESGLSAGAIYSHFASKAEIAQHAARLVVRNRADELRDLVQRADHPLAPIEILTFLLGGMAEAEVRRSLLLQIWAEATVDPEINAMLMDTVATLRAAYAYAVTPWLRATGRAHDPESARSAADSMVALSQGFIVSSALFGTDDPSALFEGIAALLA
jgi:AcrR family transcriptional regulator